MDAKKKKEQKKESNQLTNSNYTADKKAARGQKNGYMDVTRDKSWDIYSITTV